MKSLRGGPGESPSRALAEVAVASAGMVLFGLCAHQGLPWRAVGAGGLLIAAATIAASRSGTLSPPAVLGLEGFSRRIGLFTLLGGVIGGSAGLLHRSSLGIALWPAQGAEPFVLVACLIGATEEFVYRGWLLGRARVLGWPAAVLVAALAHAAYKAALFAWPPSPPPVDVLGLLLWTAAGGLVLGLLRVFTGSVIPSLVAHAVFDFVVYRSVAHAPWWVFG